jgi:hypothetical protein
VIRSNEVEGNAKLYRYQWIGIVHYLEVIRCLPAGAAPP